MAAIAYTTLYFMDAVFRSNTLTLNWQPEARVVYSFSHQVQACDCCANAMVAASAYFHFVYR